MAANIHFGSWSTTLGLGALFGLVVAGLLLGTRENRVANRLLAALILVVVLQLVPYVIGFAGFYDAYPWLSFAPFGWALAIGPLLYLHVHRQCRGRLPPRPWRHGIPVAIKLVYSSLIFVQPLAFKNDWDQRVHAPYVDPAETLLVFVSLALYLRAAWRVHRDYQRWLADHVSNREEFRLGAQRNVLIAFATMLVVWLPYEAVSYAADFNYFDRYPLYLVMAALVCALGLEGWRSAGLHFPLPADALQAAPAPLASEPEPGPRREHDWAALGALWQSRTAEAGWWRDPELSLEKLARLLGTNTAYLSRAFNEGLGLSFNEAINRLRVEAVRRELADPENPRELLDIAFAAGFSSKSSFNRVFKALTGDTPSRIREQARGARPIA